MARSCTVCEHPERARIELGLARKASMRAMGRSFSLSKDALYRHRKEHMPAQLQAALLATGRPSTIDLEALRKSESEGALQHLVAQRARLYVLADAAEDVGDIRAAAAVHARLHANFELTCKLVGEISAHAHHVTNNILVMPAYHEMRTALVQALRAFPQARQAVATVLHRIESQVAPEVREHAGP